MTTTINASTTAGLVQSADLSGALQLQTANTAALTIDTSQNVGIGTTTPSTYSAKFAIKTSDQDVIGFIGGTTYGMRFGANSSFAVIDGVDAATATSAYNPLCMRGSQLLFNTGGTERMRIDSSGNAYIAKTTTSDTTKGIQLQASGRVTSTMAESANGTDNLTVYSTGASAYRFYVGMGGNIYATSTTITGISDVRLKENIVDLDDGLNTILALKPRKFDWKEGKGKDIKGDRGFIAQEFEQVLPDLIDEWKDAPPEGELPYKSVRADLIPILVKAIQELSAKVDAQQQEINALKGAV